MLRPVEVIVSGFTLEDPSLDQAELDEAASEVASAIGMALADVAHACGHGSVILRVGGVEGTSGE